MPVRFCHCSEIPHPAGKTNIAAGRENRDCGEDEILAKGHAKSP